MNKAARRRTIKMANGIYFDNDTYHTGDLHHKFR